MSVRSVHQVPQLVQNSGIFMVFFLHFLKIGKYHFRESCNKFLWQLCSVVFDTTNVKLISCLCIQNTWLVYFVRTIHTNMAAQFCEIRRLKRPNGSTVQYVMPSSPQDLVSKSTWKLFIMESKWNVINASKCGSTQIMQKLLLKGGSVQFLNIQDRCIVRRFFNFLVLELGSSWFLRSRGGRENKKK